MANNSFSIDEYFSSVWLSVRDVKAIGLYDPIGPWDNTEPKAKFEASVVSIKRFENSGIVARGYWSKFPYNVEKPKQNPWYGRPFLLYVVVVLKALRFSRSL